MKMIVFFFLFTFPAAGLVGLVLWLTNKGGKRSPAKEAISAVQVPSADTQKKFSLPGYGGVLNDYRFPMRENAMLCMGSGSGWEISKTAFLLTTSQ